MNDSAANHPYDRLLPEVVLGAVESLGHPATGSLLALNSYENRVYQVALEDGRYLVAKFYRPDRLGDEAIREEHAFTRELAAQEIPVVAPLADPSGETLFWHEGFRFALFPRVGGRFPELDDPELLFRLGRLLGRIHAVGALGRFAHRPRIDIDGMGRLPSRFLLEQEFIPTVHRGQYQELVQRLLEGIEQRFADCAPLTEIRLHGDFHPGNILQRDEQIHIVDTDDCRMGPAVQDLWLLLSGDRAQMRRQLMEIVEGYEEFHDFRHKEFVLIEPLRTLRIIHYAYWLALRWEDPAFPRHFPWFNTGQYWDEHILTLREQILRLEEEPLSLFP